ncbi:MAG: hypothetical protein K6G71_01760 [Clostridiales bacterium]|nr:hypothetical protein [Clostridiales bacterium]
MGTLITVIEMVLFIVVYCVWRSEKKAREAARREENIRRWTDAAKQKGSENVPLFGDFIDGLYGEDFDADDRSPEDEAKTAIEQLFFYKMFEDR